jgi:hypothetical protein
LDLFGHLVTAHLEIPKSIPAHSQNLSSLLSCICRDSFLFAITAKSSAYAAEDIVTLDVPNMYQFSPCCSHLRRGSRNMMNKYGLKVSLVLFLFGWV